MGRNKFTFGILSIRRYLKLARERLAIIWNNYANNKRLFRSPRGEPRSAVFAMPTADAHLHYVITEYFIPELAKITGRDLGFHFYDLIHLKLVLGWH